MKLNQLTEDFLYLSELGYELEVHDEPYGELDYITAYEPLSSEPSDHPTIGLCISYDRETGFRKSIQVEYTDYECVKKKIKRPLVIDPYIAHLIELGEDFVEVWDWNLLPRQDIQDFVRNIILNSKF